MDSCKRILLCERIYASLAAQQPALYYIMQAYTNRRETGVGSRELKVGKWSGNALKVGKFRREILNFPVN